MPSCSRGGARAVGPVRERQGGQVALKLVQHRAHGERKALSGTNLFEGRGSTETSLHLRETAFSQPDSIVICSLDPTKFLGSLEPIK